MYINTGYLNHSYLDFKDKRRPLIVGSCGTYRLSGDPKMPTYRPKGRQDYQIIYIASGLGHFHFDKTENETIVPAGNMVWFQLVVSSTVCTPIPTKPGISLTQQTFILTK